MKECCATCQLRYKLQYFDYTGKGCTHSDADNGFLCMAFADEKLGAFMVGINEEEGICEMYTPQKEIRNEIN